MTTEPTPPAWQAAYRALNDGALLALLPVLDAAIERARQNALLLQKGMAGMEEANEQVVDQLQQAMVLRERGIDITELVAMGEALLDGAETDAPRQNAVFNQAFAYLVDLQTRKHWILDDELLRRGLLPRITDFPLEEPA